MLKEAYVYIYLAKDGWVPAGLLQYEETGRFSSSTFRYGKKYLNRPNGISVDPIQLPLQDTTFNTPEGFSVFNGIRDAGPDKWGRYLLDKKFARALSEIEYLAANGKDHVGALAFSDSAEDGPKMFTPGGFKELSRTHLDLGLCAGAIEDLENHEESEHLKKYLQYGPSLGGARPKATVKWKDRLYLAKFSLSQDSRNEPVIEYATMKLAEKAGLNVPPIELTTVLGRSVYLIERFDRDNKDLPIPFISGLTITGDHESDYSSWSYHKLVDAIVKFSSYPDKDLTELFKRMVFNILVYNNDDHLRNFGFIHAGKDRWNLSPLYDVVPAAVSTDTFSLAMVIGTDSKKASLSNALSLCERFRIEKKDAKNLIAEMQTVVDQWQKHFTECGAKTHELVALNNSFTHKA